MRLDGHETTPSNSTNGEEVENMEELRNHFAELKKFKENAAATQILKSQACEVVMGGSFFN